MLPGYVIPIAPKKAGLAVAGVSDTRRDHDLLGDVNVPAGDNSVSTCFHPQTDIRAAVPLSAHTSVWAIHSAYAAENASIRTRLLPLDSRQSSDTRSACPSGSCSRICFRHYQQGSRIAPSIPADFGHQCRPLLTQWSRPPIGNGSIGHRRARSVGANHRFLPTPPRDGTDSGPGWPGSGRQS